MKQKHYIAIAQAIKENTQAIPMSNCKILCLKMELIDALCDILKADNKNFDKTKFMEACK